ncbi:helix-turn-helix transcriptional regulator [Microbacterium invictum]|uniref:LuxR family maltose regulon positive regulatory protein n=1 Tax=Microbacterium invictum TaxID=515415 RepID=A0AA40VMX8_9MICO|nr:MULTISPECIES: LuxR C-terminal-related transcriptional regulator [Microbacterium]MBB4140896.1 LuxR family maltose regulon positive regulatory protein [Microbacterium invictum]
MTDGLRASGGEVLAQWPRTPWFLTTPPEARLTIPRPRVIAAIDTAVDGAAVVAVGAPSGYGKSTAAAEWARSAPRPVAWLSLTRFDHDDERIAHGIIAAVRRELRDVRALAHLDTAAIDVHDGTTVADALAAVLADLEDGLALVIDQVEFADALQTGPLGALALKRPPGLQLILLATLNGEDMLRTLGVDGTALGPDDLAFDATEIAAAAALVAGKGCSDSEAADIQRRTGGWPLAVRLHLGGGSASLPQDLDDYVGDVILSGLPTELATLIRTTTIASPLDAGLAAALLPDDPDAAAHVDECARRGLFLERFSDQGRRVYTWHAAFRAAVLAAEQRRAPEETAARHIRAAEYLEETQPLASVEHYLAAKQPGRAHRVLMSTWLELMQEGRARALDRLCAALPPAWADRAATLGIRACCAWIAGDTAGARLLMRRGADAVAQTPQECAVVAVAGMMTTDEPGPLRAYVERTVSALEDPRAVGHRLTPHVLFVLGYTSLRLRRGPVDAIATLRTALREAEARERPRLAARVAGTLAFALAFDGHLTEALRLAARSVPVGEDDEWQVYDGGSAACTEGFVAYWRDDLPLARDAFTDVRRLAIGRTAYEPVALMYDALAAAASSDMTWQAEALERLHTMPAETVLGVPWQGFRDCALAKLAIVRGRTDDAIRYANRSIESDDYLPVPRAVAAEVLRRAGDVATARSIVAGTPAGSLTVPARVRLMLTDALLRDDAGRDDAHIVLERALDLAAIEHILRPFADPLPEVQALLQTHATWGSRHGAFIAEALNRGGTATAAGALSAREREVLAYLRTPMTISEIAAQLFLSTNTVKTHVQSLYRKLDVTNRREAVRVRL